MIPGLNPYGFDPYSSTVNGAARQLLANDANNTGAGTTLEPCTTMTFIIPIYSGILGVLMPEKKLLPLSLMPLEVEFSLNPHALFSNIAAGTRSYTVSNFEIFAHTIFFEQQVHAALESIVAEQGLFIHYNSFYLAPVTGISGNAPSGYAQINVPFKSINSVHTVFLYAHYENVGLPHRRKLAFASHNVSKWQIRNGAFLIPSAPIEAIGGGQGGSNLNN
jgi:hypothetical protein